MNECKIRYKSSGKKREVSALLASFSNGRLKPECGEDVRFQLYSKVSDYPDDINHKKQKILTANSSRMTYTGANHNSESVKTCNYYVCVVNKRKKKMRIYDTDLYYCKPVLEVHDISVKDSETSYIEKLDSLTSSFGSKAKKRSMQSRMKYKTDVEKMSEEIASAVESSITNGNIEETSSAAVAENDSKEFSDVIPPINIKATDLGEVYNIHDVISEEEYSAIETEASEIVRARSEEIDTWKTENKWKNLVINYIEKNKNNISMDKAKLLVYYNYLLQFYKLNYRDLQKKDPCPEIPEPFKSSFCNRFITKSYSSTGRITKSLPPRMKDKILCHALIIALFINNFIVDLIVFQSDTKCGILKITKISHALACHIVYRKEKDGSKARLAQLKLPLYAPKEKSFTRKK